MKSQKFANLIKQSFDIKNAIMSRIPILENIEIVIMPLENFTRLLKIKTDFLQNHFTKEEITYCKNRMPNLAGRFAVKTAIRKALHKRIPWKKMNILPSQTQQPILTFPNNTDMVLKKTKISISITHEDDLVAAVAVNAKHDKILAVGIDAAKISRIKKALIDQPGILKKIFTPGEANKLKLITNFDKEASSIWAGKEAVSKALGIGIWHGGSLTKIQIINSQTKPEIKLKGKLIEKARDQSLSNWNLDYFNDENFTLAIVTATN